MEVKFAWHGSQNNNLILEPKPLYLTDDSTLAEDFARGYCFNYDLQESDHPTLYLMKIRFENPLRFSTEALYETFMDIVNQEKTIPFLEEEGFDGLIYTPDNDSVYYMPVDAQKQCEIIEKQTL